MYVKVGTGSGILISWTTSARLSVCLRIDAAVDDSDTRHTLKVTPRTNADCRLLLANRVAYRVDYLQRKPTTVLDRPAVPVRAPV